MIDLERLENALAELDDDVMMPSEVDGFVTGVLLCPEPIPPGEWLPIVWGGTDDVELVFGSREKADEVQGLVLQLYDHVAQALHNPSAACEPLLFEDERTDEVMWEMWIEGFEKALNLRPGLFETFYGAGAPEVAQTYRRLTELIEIARRESKLAPRKVEKLTLTAHAMIGRYVDTLNRARRFEAIAPLLANSGASPLAMPAGSVGRNDPCPCGSGRKYKKCCGVN